MLGGVAPIPWRAAATEMMLMGRKALGATWKEAADLALQRAEPLSDNEYKVVLTKNLIEQAFERISH